MANINVCENCVVLLLECHVCEVIIELFLLTRVAMCLCVYYIIWSKYHFITYCIGSRCGHDLLLDMVFVIDSSGSIGVTNFQLIREFAASITAELIGRYPRSAIGVILFSSTVHIQFNLQTYTSLNALLLAINNLPYSRGLTHTAEALTLLLSAAQNGTLGLRDDAMKIVTVITDGRSSNQSATFHAAAALHASSTFDVYAVGVGGADLTELEAIASSPEFVFYTPLFTNDGLQQIKDRILFQPCSSKYLVTVYIVAT